MATRCLSSSSRFRVSSVILCTQIDQIGAVSSIFVHRMTVRPAFRRIALPPWRSLASLLTSRTAWACLAAIAVALLAIGSIHPPPSTAAGRIAHLDGVIKCPACEDLSLAQSDAPSSVTLRREVASWVHEGWSDSRIEQAVVARYGQAGLLLPESSGPAAALYVVPIALVGTAAAGVGWLLWRRRRESGPPRSEQGGELTGAT